MAQVPIPSGNSDPSERTEFEQRFFMGLLFFWLIWHTSTFDPQDFPFANQIGFLQIQNH